MTTLAPIIAIGAIGAIGMIAATAAHAGTSATGEAAGSKVPTGKGWGVYRPDAPGVVEPGLAAASNGIFYQGGPVMLGTTNIYYIWYGNWTGNSATTILEDLAGGIGGTPYFAINTTYYDGSGHRVSNSVTFGGAVIDSYSQGTSIDDYGVFAVVQSAIAGGGLPLDSHGVYYVLSSADVSEVTGFCTYYCGWHNNGTISGVDVKYAFVGNARRCGGSCQPYPLNAPNGNADADSMATVIAHELMESVTDPDLDAWYDFSGNENGDKCNFNFGATYTTPNGWFANVHFGARDFLVQRDWLNANGGGCVIAYSGTGFYTLPPCRLVDTRTPPGPAGGPALQSGSVRTFALAGSCGVPPTAKALSVNVTVTGPASAGLLNLFAADQLEPSTSLINFSSGQTSANSAVLALSGDGTGSVNVVDSSAGPVHLILDVNGYFQ